MTIKSITHNGLDKMEIAKFTNATRAVISPDMKWVAFREYHRSFIAPFEFVGQVLTISAADSKLVIKGCMRTTGGTAPFTFS